MTAIDWSNAPEGATHYLPADTKRSWCACWYKQDSLGQWFGLNANNHDRGVYDEWTVDNDQVEALNAALIQRPDQPWSGDGLPPVGTVCEAYSVLSEDWHKVKILDHQGSNGAAACRKLNDQMFWSSRLRPIKTPAQIAADEREAAIEAMLEILPAEIRGERKATCAALYDAGYRKGDEQ